MFYFLVIKLLLLTGCSPDNGTCCVMFALTCYISAFRISNIQLHQVNSVTCTIVWEYQHITRTSKLVHTAN